MKLLNRKDFLALDKPVVFQKITPFLFEGLYIKDKTIGNDFYCLDLIGDYVGIKHSNKVEDVFETSEKIIKDRQEFERYYDTVTLDGFFNEEDMFIVYDNTDIDQLIEQLTLVKEGKYEM